LFLDNYAGIEMHANEAEVKDNGRTGSVDKVLEEGSVSY
jgi:hypothetical protein